VRQLSIIAGIKHRDGSEAHQRAIASGIWTSWAGERLTRLLEFFQGTPHRITDIEATIRARQIALTIPPHIICDLIVGIKTTPAYQALGKTKRHRGVIGPATYGQVKRTTTHHIGQAMGADTGELQRGAQGIAHRQTNQSPTIAVTQLVPLGGLGGGWLLPLRHKGKLDGCFRRRAGKPTPHLRQFGHGIGS
jgi:hypothetical protein